MVSELFNDFGLSRFAWARRLEKSYKIRRGTIVPVDAHVAYLEKARPLLLDPDVDVSDWRVGLVKDGLYEESGEYVYPRTYYPKFERFLRNNSVRYEYFDVHRSDWLEVGRRYNAVIWHPASDPASLTEARQKIYILERLGIKTLPTFDELIRYEDKVLMHYFYQSGRLPEIPTVVSCSRSEAMGLAASSAYPLISKIATGSGSYGVHTLKDARAAKALVKKVFGRGGASTYWKFLRQKNYVLFQRFVPDAAYDLRVTVVGDSLMGYYRYPKKGDFRASGSGIVEKKAIPKRALDIAWETKRKYGACCLSTDMIYSGSEDKFYIVESSVFIGVDTPRQLEVDGRAGRYIRTSDGDYIFEEGEFWLQELMLKEFFSRSRPDIHPAL